MFGRDNIYIYKTEYTEEEESLLNSNHGGKLYVSALKELKNINVESSFRTDTTHYTVEQILEKQIKFNKLLLEVDYNIQSIENKLFLTYKPRITIKEIKDSIAEWITI